MNKELINIFNVGGVICIANSLLALFYMEMKEWKYGHYNSITITFLIVGIAYFIIAYFLQRGEK